MFKDNSSQSWGAMNEKSLSPIQEWKIEKQNDEISWFIGSVSLGTSATLRAIGDKHQITSK